MAKGTSRLLKHFAKPTPRKLVTTTNTATRVRKVFTTTSVSSCSTSEVEEPLPPSSNHFYNDVDTPEMTIPSDSPAGIHVRTKARRYQNSDAPLLTWKEYRQQYLDTCLMLEGRGRHRDICAGANCTKQDPGYRCRDCFGLVMYCKECILSRHENRPLHVLEEWRNKFFHRVTLQTLGLRVQLGHRGGMLCGFRSRGHKDFVVVHTNGIHNVNIDFCGCPEAPAFRDQLLEVGWWPSTPLEPQTAATMDVLRSFHIWNLQGHIAPTDFYRGLEQLTCGDGLWSPPDRLAQWMHMVRQWRHIKMTKRAGRGHDPVGIVGTTPGGLSIPCRACPHPDINLPVGWQDAPPEVKWLYSLMLSEDANFKQKARLRTNNSNDPPLGSGWATFVQNDAYLEHLAKFVDKDEVSHCVGFAAMWNANNKRAKGLRATGIGSVSCSRHEMYRANGTGDLQKGERYANMDFLFLASLVSTMVHLVLISYDIACQWSLKFFDRMNSPTMSPALRLPSALKLDFYVPKFHLPVHVPKCHAPYSFNFARGVGRTDGEGVERNWSVLNGVAPSVSMMGPGGRWDTLDDFCNYANWRKTVNLPTNLLRKMSLAIPEAVIHHQAYAAFTESLQSEHASRVIEWEAQVLAWETDRTSVTSCPYDLPNHKISFAEVKRQLSEEEHQKLTNGEALLNVDDFTPSSFLTTALEIEEAQQALLIDIKLSSSTATQQTAIQRRRTALLLRIQKFAVVRSKYIPGLASYLNGLASDVNNEPTPELIPLHLPSSLPSEKRMEICVHGISEIEDRLRFGQASEALTKLRIQLTKRTYANQYKAHNVSGQRNYTRFRTLQEHTESKVRLACLRYNNARKALLQLRGPGAWEQTLRVLHAEDVRGLNQKVLVNEEIEEGNRAHLMAGSSQVDGMITSPQTIFDPNLAVGEGHRTLSWIWYSTTGQDLASNTAVESYLRVEWLKCRARAARWKEEIQLLEEEMRRSIQFCAWKGKWWTEQISRHNNISPHVAEGIAAYAMEHAFVEKQRILLWSNKWAAIRERATVVLKGHLMGKEYLFDIPELDVEVEEEEALPLEDIDE